MFYLYWFLALFLGFLLAGFVLLGIVGAISWVVDRVEDWKWEKKRGGWR